MALSGAPTCKACGLFELKTQLLLLSVLKFPGSVPGALAKMMSIISSKTTSKQTKEMISFTPPSSKVPSAAKTKPQLSKTYNAIVRVSEAAAPLVTVTTPVLEKSLCFKASGIALARSIVK